MLLAASYFIIKNFILFASQLIFCHVVTQDRRKNANWGGGGGCIFIYSGDARLISFEINFISKETSRAEPEYMNIHPPPD